VGAAVVVATLVASVATGVVVVAGAVVAVASAAGADAGAGAVVVWAVLDVEAAGAGAGAVDEDAAGAGTDVGCVVAGVVVAAGEAALVAAVATGVGGRWLPAQGMASSTMATASPNHNGQAVRFGTGLFRS